MKAAEENYEDILQFLLANRAKVDTVNKNGRTPLSLAAAPSGGRRSALESLLLLLEWRADPSQKDHDGRTAKARARLEKRSEASEILENLTA